MESSYVSRVDFKFTERKIKLDKVYIKFEPTDNKLTAGLVKTSFKAYLDDELIGYLPLDMLAVLPQSNNKKEPRLHLVLRIAKPYNFDKLPFSHTMKSRLFLGKIFKLENMVEQNISKDLVLVSSTKESKSKKHISRKKKKVMKGKKNK